jgi:hypothetical protein
MKINARVLGWKDKCCGCYREIKSTEKVYMISDIGGVNGSIHFCENCIVDISNSKEVATDHQKDDWESFKDKNDIKNSENNTKH